AQPVDETLLPLAQIAPCLDGVRLVEEGGAIDEVFVLRQRHLRLLCRRGGGELRQADPQPLLSLTTCDRVREWLRRLARPCQFGWIDVRHCVHGGRGEDAEQTVGSVRHGALQGRKVEKLLVRRPLEECCLDAL